jgi:hypothetical protein
MDYACPEERIVVEHGNSDGSAFGRVDDGI